jgi:hypothetical protein
VNHLCGELGWQLPPPLGYPRWDLQDACLRSRLNLEKTEAVGAMTRVGNRSVHDCLLFCPSLKFRVKVTYGYLMAQTVENGFEILKDHCKMMRLHLPCL